VATGGLDTLMTEFVDLGPEIEGSQGPQLRKDQTFFSRKHYFREQK
jgi:hypothetical protein